MNFKPKKIRKRRLNLAYKLKKLRHKHQETITSHFQWKYVGVAILLFAIPLLGLAGYRSIKSNSSGIAVNILSTVGKSLPKDRDGYTNFLLLGTGDNTHQGRDLTDTIILASLHQENKNVVMFSIPRDLFIKTEGYYGQKINSLYANAFAKTDDKELAYQAIEEAVEQITNRPIHRRARITFSTFEEIVDTLGGVTVNVPNRIHDTEYPNENYGYQTFSVEAGIQVMNGSTALKYARSRHTSNDFDRSKRQQELLLGLKEQAKNVGLLSSPGKIKKIYSDLTEGIDTNLEIREIIELASIGADFNRSNLTNLQLHDDPYNKGGFLYAPPMHLYNNTFVLRPLGNVFGAIHKYIDLHFQYPHEMKNPRPIQILNGTKENGTATSTKANLKRFGFLIIRHGNAKTQDHLTTTLYNKTPLVQSNFPEALDFLINFNPSETPPLHYLEEPYLSEADYILEIGTDFIETLNNLRENQYVPYAPPPPSEEEDTDEAEEEENTEDTIPPNYEEPQI